MSNHWLRLWHDMPTDPKFRVIAKASKQPLHLVIALYVCMMVDASKNNVSRGVTICHDEDLAVTLDCDMSQIEDIKRAMQGRLLDDDRLTGWENRQPKREDSGNPETGAKSAAERQAEKRARDKLAAENSQVTECHGASRNVTLEERREDTEEIISTPNGVDTRKRGTRLSPDESLSAEWETFCKAQRPDLDPVAVFAKFKDYWVSVPGKQGAKLDWFATWRNFVRTERPPNKPQNNMRTMTASDRYAAQRDAMRDNHERTITGSATRVA